MMAESIFQTFLLLGTFDIILISVSIANYAVSVSYLGRETRLGRGRMEKRKQRLNETIKELQAKGMPIEELKKETKEAEDDIHALGNRLFFLSWSGAVILPSICFLVSLANGVIGMNSDIFLANSQTQNGLMSASISFLGLGFFFLMAVIGVVDSAARKIPIPEFVVMFGNKTKIMECKRNEKTKLPIFIRNKGEDKAEDLEIYVHFPPTFTVEPDLPYEVIRQSRVTGVDFPDYTSAAFLRSSLHIETVWHSSIAIVAPNETQTYEIPVYIYETKTGLTKDKLTIQVTD